MKELKGKEYTHVYWDEMVDFNQQVYEGSRAGGKTLLMRRELEDVIYEQSRDTEEKAPAHLRARWISVRILQEYGFSYPGPPETKIGFMGRSKSWLPALVRQPGDSLSLLQFIQTESNGPELLHRNFESFRAALEKYLAARQSYSKEED